MMDKEIERLKPLPIEMPDASWHRDVLVGCLRNRPQLKTCLRHRFYHMPAERLEGDPEDIQWVAIYQSKALFGLRAGVRWYGRVTDCKLVSRNQITQITRDSDTPYYVFTVARWEKLPKKIACKDAPIIHIRTTEFLLRNSRQTPELKLENGEEYCLFRGMDKLLRRPRLRTAGFLFGDTGVVVRNGEICVLKDGRLKPGYLREHYKQTPYEVFRHVLLQLSSRE